MFDRSRKSVIFSNDHGKSRIVSVQFVGDSGSLMSASSEGTVRIWNKLTHSNCESFSLSTTYPCYHAELVSALSHPLHTYMIAVCKDETWQLWDLEKAHIICSVKRSGDQCRSPTRQLNVRYSAADIHPDGLILGIGTNEPAVRLFDNRTENKEVGHLSQSGSSGHNDHITGISFSENGYLMSSSSQDGVKIWDLRKLKCIKDIKTSRPAHTTRFEPSGGYLAIGSNILQLFRGKMDFSLIREFACTEPFDIHERAQSLCFGNDASFIAMGTEDHNLRIFSAM